MPTQQASLWAALVCAVLLALPAPAQAHIESGNYFAGAYSGQAAFGNPACTVHIHVWNTSPDPGWLGYYHAPTCTIYIPWGVTTSSNWQGRCTIITHEWGHARGYGHSSDPYNVMYPTYWGYNYWRCR